MKFISFFCLIFLFFSCAIEVDKVDQDLQPLSCINGAINPPACDQFSPCSNGAINPPACDQFSPCTPAGTRLMWDSYSDSSILGFKVYLGINDTNYSVVKEVTPWSATETLLAGLDITLNPCLANYIYITAYKSTIESEPSNKVCWGEACD